MLNSIYVEHKISHIIMVKVKGICTGGANKCCVFNQSYENPFGNWSKECIIDRDLLGALTRIKSFDLSVFQDNGLYVSFLRL